MPGPQRGGGGGERRERRDGGRGDRGGAPQSQYLERVVAINRVDWLAAGLLAAGSIVGGQIGATVGRRLPPLLLRAVIVVVGTVAIVVFMR